MMAKRILVPLDYSSVAETVLPVVADMARSSHATVRLLHVAPTPANRLDDDGHVLAYADQEAERLEAEGLDYLRAVGMELEGIPVERAIRFGDPVREILKDADSSNSDLIAVTTSGRGGLRRAVLASVAEGVFHGSPVAVTMFSPIRTRA